MRRHRSDDRSDLLLLSSRHAHASEHICCCHWLLSLNIHSTKHAPEILLRGLLLVLRRLLLLLHKPKCIGLRLLLLLLIHETERVLRLLLRLTHRHA